MVAVALEDFAGSPTETAVIVTLADDGTAVGAVNRPEVEIDPQDDPEQPVPATLHLTAEFVVPLTMAENCCCPPALT
jgi:hypothetical protein